MHKILPLLAVSVLSSINGSVGPSFVRPGFSFIPIISKIDYEDSSLAILSMEQSFTPYYPISSAGYGLTSSSSNEPEEGDYFYCSAYGPFPLDNPKNPDVTFSYELHSIPSQTLIERIRLFKNGSVVSASSKSSFSYTKGQRKNVSFTIPVSDYWTSNGLELRFEILNSSRSILKAYSSSFYPSRNTQVPASTLKSALYTSNSLGFYGDGNQMCELKELFDFRTIGDYIDNDYYYRLDVSRNYFLYPNNYDFSYKSAKLRFNDDEYLFPYYSHNDNGDIEIPLSLQVKSDRVLFAFNKTFYVNKRTLDTSDSYQSGWAISSNFYLPVNGRKKFNGKTIYFELNEIGYDKISTTIPLKFELNRTIVGVCTDGEYCVIGGDH